MIFAQTLIVYTLLAVLMFLFAKRAGSMEKQSAFLNAVPILLYTLVMGFRYGVGKDFLSYTEMYTNELQGLTLEEMFAFRYEKGFVVMVWICELISRDPCIFFLATSFLEVFLLYKAFNNFREVLPYIYLTFILSGIALFGYTNILRQAIAFGFFTVGLKYIPDKKIIPYLIICALATSFHISSLMMIPLFFVWIRRTDFFHWPVIECLVYLACFGIGVFSPINQLLGNLDTILAVLGYDKYTGGVMEYMTLNSKIGVTRLSFLLANLVIVFNSTKIKEHYNSPWVNIYYDLYFVGICCSFLFLGSMMLQRLVIFFTYFSFIFYGFTLKYFKDIFAEQKRICIGYLIVLFALLIGYSSHIYNHKLNTIAYVTVFQEQLHVAKDIYLESME